MKDINDIISEMNIDDLKMSRFYYNDILSIEQSNIDINNLNYWRWKYYTGVITEDEHNNMNENIRKSVMYKVYSIVFKIKSNLKSYGDFDFNHLNDPYYNSIENETTDLWLMRPEHFQYEEEFKSLIYMLYLVKKEKRFRNIALIHYNENKFARTYAEQYDENNSLFLINMEDALEYKYIYGIEYDDKVKCCRDENNKENPPTLSNVQNTDWIAAKFESK